MRKNKKRIDWIKVYKLVVYTVCKVLELYMMQEDHTATSLPLDGVTGMQVLTAHVVAQDGCFQNCIENGYQDG